MTITDMSLQNLAVGLAEKQFSSQEGTPEHV